MNDTIQWGRRRYIWIQHILKTFAQSTKRAEVVVLNTHTHTHLTHIWWTHIWYIHIFCYWTWGIWLWPYALYSESNLGNKIVCQFAEFICQFFYKEISMNRKKAKRKPTPCQWAYYIINIHQEYIYDIYIYIAVHNPCVSMCLKTKISWIVDNKKLICQYLIEVVVKILCW